MTNLMSISEARGKLPDLIKRVSKYYDRVVITVGGQPKAVVLSSEELESLEETSNILAIPGARESIKEGMKQARRGQGISFEKTLAKDESISN